MKRWIYDQLLEAGMGDRMAAGLNLAVLFSLTLLIAAILDWVLWKFLRYITVRVARRSRNNFDNFLVSHRVPLAVAHLFPLIFLLLAFPQVFQDFPFWGKLVWKLTAVIFVMQLLNVLKRFFRGVKDYLRTKPRYRDKPLDSYIQVFMIIAWIVGLLTLVVVITETSVGTFLTTLGAASAIIMLVFRDTILGFVASIQVTANDMVRIGDWITMDKYGADGDVIEISLATVKVQNFDKTITTIPTYALISDSFKNWSGMQKSGGRRIKRSLLISQKSIRFLTPEDIAGLTKVQLIRAYVEQRNGQIETYNTQHGINKELLLNGRNLTNFGVFRKYVTSYLENHPALNKEMTLMVRQLQPTAEGIPLEVYAFSADKRWQNYEYVMADIFDHLLAALPYFDLEIFELPLALEGKGQ